MLPKQIAEMFRYKHVSPDIVFGRTFFTSQIAVGIGATLIAKALRPQVFLLVNANPNANFFIGNSEVTVASGFPILANNPLVFALLENVELYAVASAPIVAYVLEMGIKKGGGNGQDVSVVEVVNSIKLRENEGCEWIQKQRLRKLKLGAISAAISCAQF